MRSKENHLKVIVAGISFAFALGLTEATLWITERITYKAAQKDEYRQIYSDERDTPYIFHHHKNISVTLKNGYYNFTFDTDKHGFRGFNDEQNSNRQSIIFIGDSITEGASVETQESFAHIVGRKLAVKTYNLGTGSYNTKHALELLKAKHKSSFNSRLIILGYCLNDTEQNTYTRYFDPSLANWNVYKYLDKQREIIREKPVSVTRLEKIRKVLRRSKVYMLFQRAKDRLQNNTTKERGRYLLESVDQEHLQFTKSHLSEIKDFAARINARLAVIIFPTEAQLKASDNIGDLQQSAIIEILDSLEIEHIPLYESFKNEYNSRPGERWFHDNVHPYKAGHELIAETITDWISSNDSLKMNTD